MDHNIIMEVITLRTPYLSPIEPAGTWNSAYPNAKAPKTQPISVSVKLRSDEIESLADDIQTLSIYSNNVIKKDPKKNLYRFEFLIMSYFV